MNCVVGWDIGGANIKAGCVTLDPNRPAQVRIMSQPFEIWREKDRLPEVLRSIYSGIVAEAKPRAAAITMTAELSDIFATKREGVLFILECIQAVFPELKNYVLDISGNFNPLCEARSRPLDYAATNWLASALWFSRRFSNCLLLDVGSTTTDILPILDGQVAVAGRTDMARLASGELVFTGALRTNLSAIVQALPVAGKYCRVASEYFAVSGDIHLILGHIRPQDYDCSTPDGQPPSVDSARRRLARLVCADVEMLAAEEIDEMAKCVHAQQVDQIRNGISQVLSRLPRLREYPAIAVGVGAFLGSAAAKSLGMKILDRVDDWDREMLAVTPCLAAAHLLAVQLKANLL